MDRWSTFSVIPEGGVMENLSPLVQGDIFPGSLIDARNFEPSPVGGYRRIKGYEKWDTNQINSSATSVDAVFVYHDSILALQGDIWYVSSGAGWTALITMGSTPLKPLATRYNWNGTDAIIICDGINPPIHYNGTTLTNMIATNSVDGGTTISTTTAANFLAATAVQEFHGHMFWSVGETIRFSAPGDVGLMDGTSGSGEFITGSTKLGMAPWRKELYLFGYDRISKVSGTNSTTFLHENVTHKVGIIDSRTIQEMNGDVYYLAFDGVRTIAGTVRNDDIELASVTRKIPKTIESLGFRSSGKRVTAVPIRNSSQYRLFVGSSVLEDYEGEGLLGGLRLNRNNQTGLEWFKIKGINAACSDSAQYLTEEYVVHGGYDGYVYRQETSNGFNGANIDAFLQFPYWNITDPELRKTLYKGKFYLKSDSQIAPTVGYTYDYNISDIIQPPIQALTTGTDGFDSYGGSGITYGSATYGSDFPINADLNLQGSGNNVSFYFNSDDVYTTWSLQSLVIEYAEDGRK
jgi:hypothetical protein